MNTEKSSATKKSRRKGCLSALLIFLLLGLFGAAMNDDGNTPAVSDPAYPVTITATVHPTATLTASPTATAAASATPTVTPTASPTVKPTATIPPYSELTRGDRGDKVRELQQRLNELGYSVGTADGSYGAKTVTAISVFQEAASLPATGIASAATQQALFAADAPRAAHSATATPTPKVTEKPVELTKAPDQATQKPVPATEKPANATVKPTEKPTEKPVITEASTPQPTKKPVSDGGSGSSGGASYIGNSNTHKFHRSTCSSVDDMNPEHRVRFSSREAAINADYIPCKRCNP